MQSTFKRVLAVILALTILLSLGLSAVLVSAEESEDASVVYNFDYFDAIAPEKPATTALENKAFQEQNAALYGSVLNWQYKEMNLNYPNVSTYTAIIEDNTFGYGFIRMRAIEGDWIAFTIKNPGAGVEQSITVTHPGSKNGADVASFYVLPTSTENIGEAIKTATAIGTVSFYDKSVGSAETPKVEEKTSILQGTWTPGNDEEYILVLEATKMHESASSAYLYLGQVTMTDASTLPLNILPEVVAEDAVLSATCSVGITSVVNGHDYMYMFVRGSQLWVYDLDTKELVDREYNAFSTPRAAVVDSNGIIWACGAAFYLYRYDPFTGEGKQIPFESGMFEVDKSFNALGIAVDENDKIYFGTYNRGYLGSYDPVTGEFAKISAWLDSKPEDDIAPDAMYAGFGGLIVKDGYIYVGIDGDKNQDKTTTHEIIKYSIAEQKVVASRDVTECWGAGGTYLGYMNLVGDYILAGSDSWQSKTCAIDITTDDLEIVTLAGDMDVGFSGFVSDEINGKVYCLGNTKKGDGMFEIDLKSMVVTELDQAAFPADSTKLVCRGGSLVTIEGDDRLPGVSLVTYRNSKNGTVEPIFYNIETMETVVWDEFTMGLGSGNQLQALTTDPTGRYVYAGAYGCTTVAQYDIEAGKITKTLPSYDHQTDSLLWHNGKLYAGNYQSCTITEIDVENGTAKPLFAIKNTAFSQYRMHALAAGDGKVFGGSVPSSNRNGGVLVWYDYEKNLTYVAAGPNPEDVFYCDTTGNPANNVWYSAVTGEKMDFDDNDDGTDDADIVLADGTKVQRFNGVIEKQGINAMVYKNGYIIGSTTRSGGSGAKSDGVGNACLFVYDVQAMKVIATCDLSTVIEGLKTPVEFVETVAADPLYDGLFWGVVSDTLFAFAFDFETNTFVVEEALSFGKENYSLGGDAWCGRNIVFDGTYMYVSFGSAGLYMINRDDPTEYKILSETVPKHMELAADGNLYFINSDTDLKMLATAEVTQPIVAEDFQALLDTIPAEITLEELDALLNVSKAYEALAVETQAALDVTRLAAAEKQAAAMVQLVFDAIPENVTLADEADIHAVRYLYNDLSGRVQKLLNISKLTAAEAKLVVLKDQAAAAEVDALINAIGKVTLESEAAIDAARAAYEALTDSQKAYVAKLSVLTSAEAALEALKNPKTGDQTAVMALAGILAVSAMAVVALAADTRKKYI